MKWLQQLPATSLTGLAGQTSYKQPFTAPNPCSWVFDDDDWLLQSFYSQWVIGPQAEVPAFTPTRRYPEPQLQSLYTFKAKHRDKLSTG